MTLDETAQAGRQEYGACKISSSLEGNMARVTVAGELDLHTTQLLVQAFTAALQKDARELIVDLGDCEFLDSTALGAFVEASQRLKRMGRRLVLVAPRRELRHTFEIFGIDRLLAIHDSDVSVLGGEPVG